jgi:hypothetical protein
MFKKSKIAIVVLVIALLSIGAVAYAQGPNGFGGRMWSDGDGVPMWTTVAEALSLETDALYTELQAGKTVAEIAEAQGVELDAVIEAVVAVHTEAFAAAVEAGELTQGQADAHVALLRENLAVRFTAAFEAGYGRGEFGRGRGGMMDRGGRGMGGMMERGGRGMGGMMNRGGGFGDCPWMDTAPATTEDAPST